MNESVKETDCTRCIHRDVCKYEEQYLKAYNAVTHVNVERSVDGRFAFDNILKCEFISDVVIHCKYKKTNEVTE